MTAGAPRERTGVPGASELLRAALEKIVFFEWRLSELTAEMAAAQSRTAAAETERVRSHDEARKAALEAQEARRHTVELEAERARLSALLARPAHAPAVDEAALFAERDHAAQLSAELHDARRELARQKDERARWLQEMIEQARQGDEAPAALAQFISELRSEVIELRDRQRRCDALLTQAGITPPALAAVEPAPPPPAREHDAVEQARKLWAEGRIGGAEDLNADHPIAEMHAHPISETQARSIPAPVGTDLLPGLAALQRSPALETHAAATAPTRPIPSAQRALVEQCLRGLTASDPARRAQAARHLAALPLPAAAPGLAAALGRESDPRARAAIARALAACGGDGAAALIAQLQHGNEPGLVRLAALDALVGMADSHARAALETATFDASAAVRRRAAALALATGEHGDLLARLSVDPDASVRAAAGSEGSVPEAPLAEEELEQPSENAAAPPTVIDVPGGDRRGPAHDLPRARNGSEIREQVRGEREKLRAEQQMKSGERKLSERALFAVRTAIMGLTESDLSAALGIEAAQTESLVQQLIAQGLLVRRGRRLIVGAAVESANAGRGA